ncbi:MAG: NAD(+)/NADH kinase [Oscillospiraceae bacterium]|jgi:NAD+ kinase|nr:NAD(+)/NADH kinase [Oscillospiraceae bacterium]
MAGTGKKIVLCINPDCDGDFSVAANAREALTRAGFETVLSVVRLRGEAARFESLQGFEPLESAVVGAKLLITFGGDGTILKAARAVMRSPVPLIGVNLGHKGFMAELEPEDTEYLIRAARGEYAAINRMMLDVELVRDGETVFSDSALNDAVVGATARAVNIEVCGDGDRITQYSGDGIVVATPTGSTAYSLSAGGPLVEPTAENILLTPICAHLMSARPFVLASDRVVTVTAPGNAGKSLWLSVDGGQPIDFLDGDKLIVSKSRHTALMAHISQKSFYDIAFNKLGG